MSVNYHPVPWEALIKTQWRGLNLYKWHIVAIALISTVLSAAYMGILLYGFGVTSKFVLYGGLLILTGSVVYRSCRLFLMDEKNIFQGWIPKRKVIITYGVITAVVLPLIIWVPVGFVFAYYLFFLLSFSLCAHAVNTDYGMTESIKACIGLTFKFVLSAVLFVIPIEILNLYISQMVHGGLGIVIGLFLHYLGFMCLLLVCVVSFYERTGWYPGAKR